MTPREIELAHKGFRLNKKEEWEQVRLLAFHSIRPHIDMTKNPNFNLSSIKLPLDPPEVLDERKLVRIIKKDGK